MIYSLKVTFLCWNIYLLQNYTYIISLSYRYIIYFMVYSININIWLWWWIYFQVWTLIVRSIFSNGVLIVQVSSERLLFFFHTLVAWGDMLSKINPMSVVAFTSASEHWFCFFLALSSIKKANISVLKENSHLFCYSVAVFKISH